MCLDAALLSTVCGPRTLDVAQKALAEKDALVEELHGLKQQDLGGMKLAEVEGELHSHPAPACHLALCETEAVGSEASRLLAALLLGRAKTMPAQLADLDIIGLCSPQQRASG